jgi:hypothetical protein
MTNILIDSHYVFRLPKSSSGDKLTRNVIIGLS